ncbi:MAG: hypothetical protein VXZ18_19520, partial [Pseudomonadota bacterium]|nr:hypothetical protein [Pseudomonadota bacterium]
MKYMLRECENYDDDDDDDDDDEDDDNDDDDEDWMDVVPDWWGIHDLRKVLTQYRSEYKVLIKDPSEPSPAFKQRFYHYSPAYMCHLCKIPLGEPKMSWCVTNEEHDKLKPFLSSKIKAGNNVPDTL